MENGYTVFWVGGKRDKEVLGTFEGFREAELFASKMQEEHKDEFDPVCGGIGITAADGELVETIITFTPAQPKGEKTWQ